jgi:predicted dehydrogenase
MSALKCAVIGAGGIGKQHAKWYQMEGCRMAAFVGRTPESVAKTAATLKTLFGFGGRGYCDVQEMLRKETPDVVSVCSPPDMHKEHTIAALAGGAHVFCEKPMVWRKGAPPSQMLDEAAQMVKAAAEARRTLGLNTQYVAILPEYLAIYQKALGALRRVNWVFMRMESKGSGGMKEYEDIWIDLASHPISLLLKWAPDGRLDEATARCVVGRKDNVAQFDWVRPDGSRCSVRAELGNIREGTPVRRFGVNGLIVDYAGRNDTDGVFKTFLTVGNDVLKLEDLMRLAIRQFVQAVRTGGAPLVPGDEGLRNLEIQLRLLDRRVRI